MAREIRLFLIRHGETVDNVAQLYAGSRDSALTNHGYQQATRLGRYFVNRGLTFTHVFSSHLQRAAKTAGLLREAQVTRAADGSVQEAPDVVQLPVLMEQDFGFYEGKKFYERPVDGKQMGKEYHRHAHKDSEGFMDIESKESLAQRADTFLDGHLLPLLDSSIEQADLVVAIVSHGIMLSSLWKRILLRLPEKSVKLAPELAAASPVTLEHLGAWSNTGFLELHMLRTLPEPTVLAPPTITGEVSKLEVDPSVVETSSQLDANRTSSSVSVATSENPLAGSLEFARPATKVQKLDSSWSTVIHTINGKDHLKNLKRTGGGVGSSRHDASQRNIESFFKRRKVD